MAPEAESLKSGCLQATLLPETLEEGPFLPLPTSAALAIPWFVTASLPIWPLSSCDFLWVVSSVTQKD
jgi:hypothetical protein